MNQNALKWLYQVSGKEKRNIVFLVLVQAFLGLSTVVFIWLLRGSIDCAVAQKKEGFLVYTMAMGGIMLLQILGNADRRFLDEYTKSGMENCFKIRLFEQLLTRDYAHVSAIHSGEWMNRLTSDVLVVAEGMTVILPDVIGLSVRLVGAIIALLILIPKLAYVLIPGGLFLLVFSTASRKVLKRLHIGIQEADGKLCVHISERLASLLVVRTFAREGQTIKEAEAQMKRHKNARMKRTKFSIFCNAGFSFVIDAVYMIGVFYCGYGILLGTVSYGSFTAVLQLIGQVQTPFAGLTSYLPKFYAMLASAERLMEAEKFEAVNIESRLGLNEIKHFYNKRFSAIGFHDVSFTYLSPVLEKEQNKQSMPVIIKNLNLKIYKGECVAFTGPSGSGKSTILKLLMGLYTPDSGSRFLETAFWQDSEVVSEKMIGRVFSVDARYTRLFAYVPQGNHLMSGTIRDIVTFSEQKKIDEQEIYEALRIACAWEFVKELAEGINTELGERGAGLSEGQMQRLAIARAVYSRNPILVLDEATSALDEATEKQLLENLCRMTDRTILLVTHRPAVLTLCNRQIIFGENEIEVKEYGRR